MQLDRISYQRVYPIGNFATERIGVEASLDKDENPETALQRLQIIVNDLHSATIADLEQYRGTHTRVIEPVDATIQGIIQDIGNCTVVDEKNGLGVQVGLVAYLDAAANFAEIKAAYDKKMEELTNKTK